MSTTQAITDYIREQTLTLAARGGARAVAIDPATSLVRVGLLDSLGFTELIAAIETRFDVELDLLSADPEEFMTLAGLTAATERAKAQAAPGEGGSVG